MVVTAAALVPLGFLVPLAGLGGWLFAIGATALSAMFLRRAILFARDRTDRKARKVLHASLFHLPGVFALLMIDALLVAGCGGTAPRASAPTEPDLDYPVGEFTLTERSGAQVTDKDLRGSVWVGSFIFTRCNGPCPAVTATMANLQRDLADELKGGKLKLVTFTVDPARDDLKSLNEYATARGADPKNWLFLTGDEKTVHTLLEEQFKQAVERKIGPDVRPGDEFGHSTRLVLVDKNGVLRAMYEGLPNDDFPDGNARFAAGQKRLKERVRELLK
jgi:cytochrome oxidase Cu insertion factor (SCO1/SenC/PrrC family)